MAIVRSSLFFLRLAVRSLQGRGAVVYYCCGYSTATNEVPLLAAAPPPPPPPPPPLPTTTTTTTTATTTTNISTCYYYSYNYNSKRTMKTITPFCTSIKVVPSSTLQGEFEGSFDPLQGKSIDCIPTRTA